MKNKALVPVEKIQDTILLIRDERIIIDSDLSEISGSSKTDVRF